VFSPYGLHWPAVFQLYFRHNALLDFPSRVFEFTPGFELAQWSPIWLLLVLLLALTPSALSDVVATPRERIVFGLLWFAGLFGFGLAGRAMIVWWFASLPALARVIDRLPSLRHGTQQRIALSAMAALPLVMAASLMSENRMTGADVSSPVRWSVDPLARWVDEHSRPNGRPRVLTTFNYGSYLTWRMPAYSMSIDGRTIFPDSASAPDAYRVAEDRLSQLGPWQGADLALLPQDLPVAAVLDTARDWVRVGTVPKGPRVTRTIGLWVRQSWLDHSR
jgi:hypothetical protein